MKFPILLIATLVSATCILSSCSTPGKATITTETNELASKNTQPKDVMQFKAAYNKKTSGEKIKNFSNGRSSTMNFIDESGTSITLHLKKGTEKIENIDVRTNDVEQNTLATKPAFWQSVYTTINIMDPEGKTSDTMNKLGIYDASYSGGINITDRNLQYSYTVVYTPSETYADILISIIN